MSFLRRLLATPDERALLDLAAAIATQGTYSFEYEATDHVKGRAVAVHGVGWCNTRVPAAQYEVYARLAGNPLGFQVWWWQERAWSCTRARARWTPLALELGFHPGFLLGHIIPYSAVVREGEGWRITPQAPAIAAVHLSSPGPEGEIAAMFTVYRLAPTRQEETLHFRYRPTTEWRGLPAELERLVLPDAPAATTAASVSPAADVARPRDRLPAKRRR